jgi:hypothetical protein
MTYAFVQYSFFLLESKKNLWKGAHPTPFPNIIHAEEFTDLSTESFILLILVDALIL